MQQRIFKMQTAEKYTKDSNLSNVVSLNPEDIEDIIGDVEGDDEEKVQNVLKRYVDRIENINEEIDNYKNDEKVIYAEAKAAGFDVKILRQVIKRRKRAKAEIEEEEFLVTTYERALEQFNDMLN